MNQMERCDWSELPVHECAHCQPSGTHEPTEAERAEAIVTRLERGEARERLQATKPTSLDLVAHIGDLTTEHTKRRNGGSAT